MNKQTKQIALLGLVAGAAAVSLFLGLGGRTPKINLGTYEALGAVTAEETARLLGGKGRVLVIARDTGADKNPSVEAQLDMFTRTLKKQAGVSHVTERFEATPMLMMATGGAIPPDQLAKALQTHANIDALVLFCAIPPLADAELDMLRKRNVKTVVVASFRGDYAQLLEQKLINLVISPRQEAPPPSAQPPRTLRELFDRDFVIVTAADALRER